MASLDAQEKKKKKKAQNNWIIERKFKLNSDYIYIFEFPDWRSFQFSCLASGRVCHRVAHLKDRTLISPDEIKRRHNSQTFYQIKNTPFFH